MSSVPRRFGAVALEGGPLRRDLFAIHVDDSAILLPSGGSGTAHLRVPDPEEWRAFPMARTELMSFLRRLAAEHAEAQRRGVTLESVRRERSMRRRDVLKAMGALAGAAVVTRSAPVFAAGKAPRIAIVGA